MDLVQDMYNGVKAMIDREVELNPHHEEESKSEAVLCGPQLADPSALHGDHLVFPEGTKSLLSKYCTQEVWAANKNLVDKFGFSFKQAIFSGCKNTDSSIGVYAGSHDSYHAFSKLFNPIIQEYHDFPADGQHVSNMDASQLNCPHLFTEDDHDKEMIVSTRIRVGRNLAEYPLGPGLTKEQRIEIE